MATVRGYIRTVPGGAFVADGTPVELRAELNNALLASTSTLNGEYTFSRDGSYPPYRVVAVTTDVTKITSSKVTGMTGPTTLSAVPYMFRAWSDGVIANVFGVLAVTAGGASMNITIDAGGSHVRGIIYDQLVSRTITIPTANASNPRIDTVVIEVAPSGSGDNIEGRSELKLLAGSPGASPVAPALTQSSTVWQMPLADVRVDAGISAIASNKVTDRRVFSSPSISDGGIGTAALASLSVTLAKMAANSVDASKIVDGSVGSSELASSSVTLVKLASNSVNTSKVVDRAIGDLQIAQNAVHAFHIRDADVGTSELADNAVTSAKIADGTIVAADLNTSSITEFVQDIVGAMLVGGYESGGEQVRPRYVDSEGKVYLDIVTPLG